MCKKQTLANTNVNNQKTKKRCGKFTFKLAGKSTTFFKDTVIIQFNLNNLQTINTQLKDKILKKKHCFPTFNYDRKYYTPTFINPALETSSDSLLLEQHQKRIKQATEEQQQIYVSKPRSKYKFCGICKQHYEDYLQHIQTQKHCLRLRNSLFQSYILQQAQKFNIININNKQMGIKDYYDTRQQTLDEEELLNSYLDLKRYNSPI